MNKGTTSLVVEDALIGTILRVLLVDYPLCYIIAAQCLATHLGQVSTNGDGRSLVVIEGHSANLLDGRWYVKLLDRYALEGAGAYLLHTLLDGDRVDELVAAESEGLHLLDAAGDDDIGSLLITYVKTPLIRIVCTPNWI